MIKRIGQVIDVFIPEEYRAGRIIDEMDSNKIGFKIMIENEIIEVIQIQNEYNAEIMVDDMVVVTEQNISGKTFIDIELYDGDDYE